MFFVFFFFAVNILYVRLLRSWRNHSSGRGYHSKEWTSTKILPQVLRHLASLLWKWVSFSCLFLLSFFSNKNRLQMENDCWLSPRVLFSLSFWCSLPEVYEGFPLKTTSIRDSHAKWSFSVKCSFRIVLSTWFGNTFLPSFVFWLFFLWFPFFQLRSATVNVVAVVFLSFLVWEDSAFLHQSSSDKHSLLLCFGLKEAWKRTQVKMSHKSKLGRITKTSKEFFRWTWTTTRFFT
jgi:hypothetical protein